MKYILSFIVLISISLLTFSQEMVKKIFITNVGTVEYYRPDMSLVEALKENPAIWNQINYCISYLDKMQETLKNEHTLSNLSKPYMGMNEAILSIKEKSRKDKVYKALSKISSDMFQCEYDSYLTLDNKMLKSEEKDSSLIFSKDSIEAMYLFREIAHLCNSGYTFLQSGTAQHSLKKVVKYALSDNNENYELLFSYYITKEKEFRLSVIQGNFEDIYQIWTKYFGSNDNKEAFIEFPNSKTMTIRIKGMIKPLNLLMNPIGGGKWGIRI